MGQYYHPISLDKKQHLSTHDYDNGLKLMEHSYIGNSFMDVVEFLLSPLGEWHKNKLVWAGDYADPEPDGKDENDNLNHRITEHDKNKINPTEKIGEEYHFIVNHDTKEYIDKRNVNPISKEDDYQIHPLSLLTCEGNGRGGGDFRGEDKRIGMWARNSISIEKEIPKDYTEIDGNFVEE